MASEYNVRKKLSELLKALYEDTAIRTILKEEAEELAKGIQKYPLAVKEAIIYAHLTLIRLFMIAIDVLTEPGGTDMSIEALKVKVTEKLKEDIERLKNNKEALIKIIEKSMPSSLKEYIV